MFPRLGREFVDERGWYLAFLSFGVGTSANHSLLRAHGLLRAGRKLLPASVASTTNVFCAGLSTLRRRVCALRYHLCALQRGGLSERRGNHPL